MSYVILGFILLIVYVIVISVVDKLMVHLPFGLSISINGVLFAIIFVLFLTPVILKINNIFLSALLVVVIFVLGYNTSIYLYNLFVKGEQGEMETDYSEIIRKMSIGKSLFDESYEGTVEIDFDGNKVICKNSNKEKISKGDSVVVTEIKEHVFYVEKIDDSLM